MSTVTMNVRPAQDLRGRDGYNDRREVRWPARGRGRLDVKIPIDLTAQRLRVLVVDDHRDGADTLSMLVGLWGHEVKRTYDGATGLALAGAFRPDVLLLDVMMANISGIDLAPQLRQLPGLKNCLMIAVTGRTGAKTRAQCEQAGIDLILTKPVCLENLKTLLALESVYRLRSLQNVRKNSALAAIAARRTGMSSSWRKRPSYDGLQVTVAS